MSQARRKEPMSNLIRDLHMHNAHQDALVSGRVHPVEDDEPMPKPRFTYSIEWDDRNYWDGWNVRCNETGQWMREEGFSTERKAQELLERLENPEGEE